MSKLVNLAQGQTFKNDATAANQKRGNDECWPKTNDVGQCVAKIGTYHVEGRMRKIQNAHHAENQREA